MSALGAAVMKRILQVLRSKRAVLLVLTVFSAIIMVSQPQARAETPPEPVVAVHVSELTQALEKIPAKSPTPVGTGTTGYEWWHAEWHYFVMAESLKEALRSDGTPFIEVSDADIKTGRLLHPDGSPRYPILISLASEAVADNEVAPLREYVSAGGFLFAGSSAFTRNPDGTTRGDFALAAEMGLHMANARLQNWYENLYFTKVVDHRLAADIPGGTLTWRMPLSSEEIPLGVPPYHYIHGLHWVFQVSAANGATVIANGEAGPLLATTQYGKGNFIYHGAMQPLIAHGGYDSGLYAYLIYRNAIEWAFESADLPIIRLSPWRYEDNAAFVVRHDFENIPSRVLSIEDSASFENSFGIKGDYYFCTGTLREEMTGAEKNNAIAGLRRAVSNYGATIGSHNGGLKNPVNASLLIGDFDYWHWGPDEALDVTLPGYASGKAYAQESVSQSFQDIEGWLSGVDNGRAGCGAAGNCPRIWASPYFNSTRENSYDIVYDVGAVSMGEQKIGPFPHWTLSTRTAGKRYSHVTVPAGDWFKSNGTTAQAMEDHTSATMRAAVDFYYNLGSLVSIYGHSPSVNGSVQGEYVTYSAAKPRIWAANAVEIHDWWKMRSNAAVTTDYAVTGNTATALALITGAADIDTAIEVAVPGLSSPDTNDFEVYLDGAPADPADYRILGKAIKIRVGSSTSSAEVRYTVPNPKPATTSLSPTAVAAGGLAFTLTVNGGGFINDSVVRWNGSNRATTFISSKQLMAAIPAADIASGGTVQVTVFTPAPGGGTSNVKTFTTDGTPPTLVISAPSATLARNATSVSYMVDYTGADAVTLGTSDVTLNSTGSASGTVHVTGSGTLTRTVTISSLTGNGTLGISITAGTASDLVGNTAAAAEANATFTVDTTAPSVAISAPSLTVANSSVSVAYTLTYTGADTITCAAGDVTLNNTGTANGSVAVSGTGTSGRTVTISNITGFDGTLGITIAANSASDKAGNLAAGAGPSATFTVDNSSGDFDGDGVNVVDALTALRITAGLGTPTGPDSVHGDVAPLVSGRPQPDGKIDIGDVVVILRKAVGLTTW